MESNSGNATSTSHGDSSWQTSSLEFRRAALNRRPPDLDIGGLEEGDSDGSISNTPRVRLREQGRGWEDIRAELLERKSGDFDWRRGRIPIYIYHDNEELLRVSNEAYSLYFTENALGRHAFPSLVRMENEIIEMCLALFRAPDCARGSFTSGGTESIFLVLKAARDRFLAQHPECARPRVLAPRTAHPAFDKAAHYLGIEVVRIDLAADLRVNVDDVERKMDDRTMMIVGSAPCYPYGVYDSIAALGEIAVVTGVWLHVDACLGGFLAPFAREVGYPVPEFDFSVAGVASLSADLHKHGFAAKGASVLLYRSADLKAFQGFQFNDWPRGRYSTETFLGTRPGGAIASAWAVSQYLGHEGYCQLAAKTMAAKTRLVQGIDQIPELEVIRPSELSVVLYRSVDPAVDLNAVAELLGDRGWFVGRCREPPALHLALNPVHHPIVDEYLADLADIVRKVRVTRRVGKEKEVAY